MSLERLREIEDELETAYRKIDTLTEEIMEKRGELLIPLLIELPWKVRYSGELYVPKISKTAWEKLSEVWKFDYHDATDLTKNVVLRIDDGELSLLFMTDEARNDFMSAHKELRDKQVELLKEDIDNLNKEKEKIDRYIVEKNEKITKLM